jgi:catechol 2,3-dioxygenase-like lactoylglutathione lyase family enzyme
MAAVQIDVLFAAAAVSELDRSQRWYERLLGRPPDIVVNDDEVMWRAVDAGWLYLTVDAERAGRSIVTLAVGELDGVVAEVGRRGVELDEIEVVPGAGRKARFADPDGNLVWVIEVDQ